METRLILYYLVHKFNICPSFPSFFNRIPLLPYPRPRFIALQGVVSRRSSKASDTFSPTERCCVERPRSTTPTHTPPDFLLRATRQLLLLGLILLLPLLLVCSKLVFQAASFYRPPYNQVPSSCFAQLPVFPPTFFFMNRGFSFLLLLGPRPPL